jgi:SAM-dependent methyltransferase
MEIIQKLGSIIPNSDKAVVEIELRYLLDDRKVYNVPCTMYTTQQTIQLVKEIIVKYKDYPCMIMQSINFIDGQRIKQLSFKDGIQQPNKAHYLKQQIISPIFLVHNTLPTSRLMCNFETPIPEFPASDAKIARIRLRYTITLERWQIDITLVKSVENLQDSAGLKTTKSKMLYKIEDFIKDAPWSYAEFIELELEFIGKDFVPEDLIIGNEIFDNTFIANNTATNQGSNEYQNIIYAISKLITPERAHKFKHDYGINQLSNRVIGLDKNIFLSDVLPNITNYYLTDKTDGLRTIIYIANNKIYYVNDKLNQGPIDTSDVYVIDTELYKETYYIFDVMVYKGEVLTKQPFEKRMQHFSTVSKLSKNFKEKIFAKLSKNFQNDITKYKGYDYETDGYILTPADGNYDNMTVYKYKPISRLSIDMMLKKCPKKLLGITPYIGKKDMTLYLLFSGVSGDMFRQLKMDFVKHYQEIFPAIDKYSLPRYLPIQFCPGDFVYAHLYWDKRDDLDGQVGEFVCTGCMKDCNKLLDMITKGNNIWELQHIRTDRVVEIERGNYFGNDVKFADQTWMNYKDPLVIENIKVDAYFQENDNPIQKATRNFHSYVKAQIFAQFKGTEYAMDLASGKGQDLTRYSTYQFKNVVFLEIDNVALLELTKRKYGLSKTTPINIKTHQIDLNEKYTTNISRLEDIALQEKSMDIIMCNFAFHYLIKNKAAVINIARFIAHYIKPGGRFIFTAFDANDIIRLLNEHKGEWTVRVDNNGNESTKGEIKHSIKRKYTTSIVEPVGQQIEILLPFSKTQYYTEYLTNIAYISIEFEKLGFSLEIDQSFSEYLDSYKTGNSRGYQSMTDNDKKLSSLYHYYCFYKKKN